MEVGLTPSFLVYQGMVGNVFTASIQWVLYVHARDCKLNLLGDVPHTHTHRERDCNSRSSVIIRSTRVCPFS